MNFAKRFGALVAILLLVATVLTGCGGCGGNKPVLNVDTVDAGDITYAVEQSKTTENPEGIAATLSDSEFNNLLTMLKAAYAEGVDVHEYLVAAYRGHNMLNPNAELDATKTYTPDTKAAYDAIMKANSSVKEKTTVTDVKISQMTETDLLVLVNAMQYTALAEEKAGFFDPILQAVGKALSWLTNTLGGGYYIIGICIFAIIIEICMLPFAIKQQKNSIKQAKLRPKEMAIRNKYKNRNDQASMQKMQQEIQEFYQKENFSPYSGCLQLVLQMPIIMALYYIVIDPLHYVLGKASALSTALATYYTTSVAAGGMGGTLTQGSGSNNTIEILSVLKNKGIEAFEGLKEFAFFKDGGNVFAELDGIIGNVPKFNVGNLNLGEIPSFTNFSILLLVPVLTFAIYFVSSKLTRKLMNTQPQANSEIERRQMACSNVMMDVMMPALSASFTFMVPALVGIYWIFRCMLNMLKQFIMAKAMPLPVFTEEDYKAAAKEMAGKRPVKKSSNVGKVRSLHHIDDEDFDDTRERALARKAAIEEREREEQAQKAEQAEKMPLAAAPIKKDNKKKNNQKNKPQNVTLPKSYAKEAAEEKNEADAPAEQVIEPETVVAEQPVAETEAVVTEAQNDSEKKIDEE